MKLAVAPRTDKDFLAASALTVECTVHNPEASNMFSYMHSPCSLREYYRRPHCFLLSSYVVPASVVDPDLLNPDKDKDRIRIQSG